MNKELKEIILHITQLATQGGLHPQQLSKSHVLSSGTVTEWMLRKNGGLSAIIAAHFPQEDKNLVEIEGISQARSYVKKLEKQLAHKTITEDSILRTIKDALSTIKIDKVKLPKVKVTENKRNMALELMLSDIHYGKKTATFDLEICRQRLKTLTTVFLKELADCQKDFNVNRIVIALLGDIIESYTMHGFESAMSSEFPNSVQVKEAIESLFFDVIVPIASTGITIDIPAVTGNHDRAETSKTMHNPGETNLTWIIYHSLDLLIKQAGLTNVTMHIPKDSYIILSMYGNNFLYEHTDSVRSPTKDVLEKLMQKRSQQVGLVIDFLRGGHWHEYVCYGRGRIIINESVPGQDSYARVMGFNSHAGQTINYYVETSERPSCFYKSFPVYLS